MCWKKGSAFKISTITLKKSSVIRAIVGEKPSPNNAKKVTAHKL